MYMVLMPDYEHTTSDNDYLCIPYVVETNEEVRELLVGFSGDSLEEVTIYRIDHECDPKAFL